MDADLPDELFVIVPRWETFQHYRDRDPVWIKVYTKLLHDPNYLQLSLASRGLLQMIWLAYASTSFRLCVADVRALVGHNRGIGLQLISLRDAGFIDISASALLATKKEVEKEKEKALALAKNEKGAQRELLRRAHAAAANWNGDTSEAFDDLLDALENELHAQLPASQRSRLWDEALKRQRLTNDDENW